MLLPLVTSWNAFAFAGFAYSVYRVGLMGASPVVEALPRYWLIKARMAVNVGAAAEVPPTAVKVPPAVVRNPDVQVPAPASSEQNR